MQLSLNLSPRWHHRHVVQTDSTMCQLRNIEFANNAAEFELLTADFQTEGHGQRGTHWEADAGMNLLFSFRFKPSRFPAARQFLLSEALAIAVAESLAIYVEGLSVKWPNDVYAGNCKICGMLLEHTLVGTEIDTTLTGVGLNVNQRKFRGNAPNPVSLFQLCGKEVARKLLLESICANFEKYYDYATFGNAEELHRKYKALLFRRTGFHPYRDVHGEFLARIVEVRLNGMLVLEDEAGEIREYAFKEVSVVI